MGALDGIRVVEVAIFWQGPWGTAYLADMGAEVIHVESLRGGDPSRGIWSLRVFPVADWNFYFEVINRNKKSVAVNLMTEKGKDLIYELIKKSDVFTSNLQPSSLKKMGVDYATLSRINPRIIYVRASSYGRYGPDIEEGAYDATGQARSGLMSTLGEPGECPVYTGVATGDAVGGLCLAYGVMLGLYHREQTGIGQEIDASLLGGQVVCGGRSLQAMLSKKNNYFQRQHSRKEASPLWNIYPTKDKWIYLCMVDSAESWSDLCSVLGVHELRDDVRFNSSEKRYQNRAELIEILDKIIVTKTSREWAKEWAKSKVVATPCNNFADVSIDPQALENQYIVPFNHPTYGQIKLVGFPIQLSKTPLSIRMPAPQLGQHTEEIMLDLLGYSWDDIVALKEQNVIL